MGRRGIWTVWAGSLQCIKDTQTKPGHSVFGGDATGSAPVLNKPCCSVYLSATCVFWTPWLLNIFCCFGQETNKQTGPLCHHCQVTRESRGCRPGDRRIGTTRPFATSQLLLKPHRPQPMPLPKWTQSRSRTGCQMGECPGDICLSQDPPYGRRGAWSPPSDQRLTQNRVCSLRWSFLVCVREWLSRVKASAPLSSDYGAWEEPERNLWFHDNLIQLRTVPASGGFNLSLRGWSWSWVYTELPVLRGI